MYTIKKVAKKGTLLICVYIYIYVCICGRGGGDLIGGPKFLSFVLSWKSNQV